MEDNKNLLMIGLELDRVMKMQGFKQIDLAKKICEDYPNKDNGSQRKLRTTKNNISQLIRGIAIHADTLDKCFRILGIIKVDFQIGKNVLSTK